MQTKKNVLYVSYDGMTDPLGQSQVIPYLKGIAADGYRFYLISYEKPHLLEKNKQLIVEQIGDSDIVWLPQRYTKKPPILSGIYDFIKGVVLSYYYIFRFNIGIVHCRGAYITSLMAYLPIVTLRLQYIFDMRGFYADERADSKVWDRSSTIYNFIYLFFKKFERIAIKRANVVVTLTYAAKEWIDEFYKLNKDIVVIPCCADEDVYVKKNKEIRLKYRDKLGLKDQFVLIYLGSLGTWYMLDKMLDFFKVLKVQKPDAKFLFISNEEPSYIINKCRIRDLREEDILINPSPRSEISSYLSVGDATIFFILPVFSKKGSSPVKHAEVLLSHLPLICNSQVGDVEQIVNQSETGYVVENFTEVDYLHAINKIDLLIAKENNSGYRTAYEEYYSLKKGISLYREIYTKISN